MNSALTIRLEREATDRPWGFRLQGENSAHLLKIIGLSDDVIWLVFRL